MLHNLSTIQSIQSTTFFNCANTGYQRHFEALAYDLFRLLPVTLRSNRWILTVEKLATRYVELFALPDGSAKRCAHTLAIKDFFLHAILRKILSDNGVHFVLFIMQQYIANRFSTRQFLIPVYRPQANPVEQDHDGDCLSTKAQRIGQNLSTFRRARYSQKSSLPSKHIDSRAGRLWYGK